MLAKTVTATVTQESTSKPPVGHDQDSPDPAVPVTTSVPLELPLEQEALYREVLLAMEAEKIPYAVAGAFALQKHTGICRHTKDLDLFLRAEEAPTALEHLQRHGFTTEVRDPVWLAKAHRDDFFVDLITGMSNAVFVVDSSWIELASRTLIVGVPTRVLAAEELIVSKLFVTRRERFDGADIAHVIYGTKGKLDWNRIVRRVGEHWEVLLWTLMLFHYVYPAHAGFVPSWLWMELTGRFLNEIHHPDPQASFRGSLIDENMFAIDLKEWGLEDLLEGYRQRRSPKISCFPETKTG